MSLLAARDRSTATGRRVRRSRSVGALVVLLSAVPAPAAIGAGSGCAPERACSGGETTVFDASPRAYGRSLRNLGRRWSTRFRSGKALFVEDWAKSRGDRPAPLGPLANGSACTSCHFRDGRAGPGGETPRLLHLSVPGMLPGGAPRPHPVYGLRLQEEGHDGLRPEGRVRLVWEEAPGRYPDGARYSLRRPVVHLEAMAYGAPGGSLQTSLRMPPAIFGLGLLEAVPEAAILALADPEDADGDGISGRPNRLPAGSATERIGRFGWKAGQADLEAQIADALLEDLGVTSRGRRWSPCPPDRTACRRPGARQIEIADHELARLLLYVRILAVPARRGVDRPGVRRGEALFRKVGCAACHRPRLVTGDGAPVAALGGQTIRPYTDLLLHDMGSGLADGRPEHAASGREWRTPPLWGLGLLETVNGGVRLLHDGRARSAEEAILWHGGEAAAAQESFRRLPAADRHALLDFLASL